MSHILDRIDGPGGYFDLCAECVSSIQECARGEAAFMTVCKNCSLTSVSGFCEALRRDMTEEMHAVGSDYFERLTEPPPIPDEPKKPKRDIFRFNGSMTKAIDLGMVTAIDLEGKRISFHFQRERPDFIDLDTDEAALSVYEVILRSWAG